MRFSIVRVFLTVLFAITAFVGSGCAGLPSQFASETPPLSTADQNIVIACATIRQDLPTTEMVLETGAPLLLQQLAKQPNTQARDGLFLYELGGGLAAFTGTGPVPTNIVANTAGSLNTSVAISDDSVIQAVITDAQAPITSEVTQLETLGNSATNPDVKAYAFATIPIVVNGLGVALETSFGSYAPTTATAVAMLERQRTYLVNVKKHAKTVMLTMINDPGMTEKALRDFRAW
jgi:hypothetical protein